FISHFLRMAQRESVGSCCNSATSSRKSRRSSLADSSRILATSDRDTDSPRLLEITCWERSRKLRSASEIRMERVCCWGFSLVLVEFIARYRLSFRLRYCRALQEENSCRTVKRQRAAAR